MKKRLLSLLLVFLTTFSPLSLLSETVNAADDDISIATAEDWLRFAEACRSDSYSRGRKFRLKADIDLSGTDYSPIPYFAGTLLGGGHTVSGLELTADGSRQGLFRVIGEEGFVSNLKVSGTVKPGGTRSFVGGLAGENRGTLLRCAFTGDVSGYDSVGGVCGLNAASGLIDHCSFSGKVEGEHKAGGICGHNEGSVLSCWNQGTVNGRYIPTTAQNRGFDIAVLSQDDFLNISDVGGITGYNTGLTGRSTNSGAVGYENTGYNVGGIVGRNSGAVTNCDNSGTVRGRKDVGGIVGQLEPYTRWDVTKSKLTELNQSLEDLNLLVSRASADASGASAEVSGLIDRISGDLSSAMQQVRSIMKQASDQVQSAADAAAQLATLLSDYRNDPAYDKIRETLAQLEALSEAEGDPSEIASQMAGLLSDLLEETSSLLDPTLAEKIRDIYSGLSFTPPNLENVESSLKDMVEAARALSQLSGTAGTDLSNDVQDLSDQVSLVYGRFFVTAEDVADVQPEFEDVSDLETNMRGLIRGSVNKGSVFGETNAGGVVGAVSFEISFDLEDRLRISDYLFNEAHYLLYAAVHSCVHHGSVSAKKTCAGGIAGRMDFGAAVSCISSGTVSVAEGNYAGGICGLSDGLVRACSARVLVSCNAYAGGICGSASSVVDCLSCSFFEDPSEYTGGIAGTLTGTASGNFFVENGLGAIDGVSYEGKAESLSYEDMLLVPGVPEEFGSILITFVANGEVVGQVEPAYGSMVTDLPRVPNDGDRFWQWNEFSQPVYYSQVVEGSYRNPLRTVSTEGDRPLFLTEGIFYPGDMLTAESLPAETLSEPASHVLASGRNAQNEAWRLTVPGYSGTLTVRWHKEKGGNLYALLPDGSASPLSYETDGSYLVFTLENGSAFLYAEGGNRSVLPPVLGGACLLAALGIVVFLLLRKKRQPKGDAA